MSAVLAEPVITLTADHPTHPNLVRAHHGRELVGYTIRDAYGWAVVARRATVCRFDPRRGQAEDELRHAAVRGLFLLASMVCRPLPDGAR